MSAQSLQVITLVINNPEWHNRPTGDPAVQVNASISFEHVTSFVIRTLASNGANSGDDVTGLLYVPDLPANDPCINTTAPYVPQNATRQANLPMTDYDLIAIAPWVTPACSLKYMAAARQDPVRGFLFFLPGNNDTQIPPDPKDPVWDAGDNGQWKSSNGFPVYAIPGYDGNLYMQASANYSGNMTQVPNGDDLAKMFFPEDYVRLFTRIDTGGGGGALPSLWVFLLVVLGILIAIIGLTSLTMHWLQRRRRQALRRRVASGEVDLEALGIKRLTVPQELLDEMPLYTYGTAATTSKTSQRASTIAEEKVDGTSQPASDTSLARPAPALRSTSYRPTPLSQPTCAICLDDFVPADSGTEGTTVRELPCHHIFHPECVDTFLRDSSSLCPMCKKTALPKGYCPKSITNAMVRRERMVRTIRERMPADSESAEVGALDHRSSTPLTLGGRIRSSVGLPSRRTFSASVDNSQQLREMAPSSTEGMTDTVHSSDLETLPTTTAPVQPPATPGRREWARRRAENMLGPRAPEDPDEVENQRTPAWRKAVRSLFPGFRR
ncbi:hypothetical protein DOTSEDRAFT_70447 [Dothistroma septosporum NZE10]|uniref:RING-type domain-containing protein n=1 Tax=Dothistroma septosporum (strain NZE10 / CBS 128990) TaxID=675120 RepID=N1PSM2_DOTSN|nr:hypothetical protein DOTSEDRAFT_70447 [Dothistroma septosporum NZE10]